ncbi:MAG TPA: hypothetical protein VG501_08525 [Rhizomicrobium sp.]|nr:hypothetical protein [Rhizomicrobium sp.]
MARRARDHARKGRDALGNFCFYLHLAVMALIVLGWMLPSRGLLIAYLVFVPATLLHWFANGGACALNNLENWLRYRSWRAPERNPEEGAWLRTLLRNLTGLSPSRKSMNVFIYAAMGVFWALGWYHFLQFQGA